MAIGRAILYLKGAPMRFEVSAQIKIAQVTNSNNVNSPPGGGVNIENLQILLAHMTGLGFVVLITSNYLSGQLTTHHSIETLFYWLFYCSLIIGNARVGKGK